MRIDHRLASLILIYSENHSTLDENSLQYCVSLVDLASTSLQRVKSLESMERQLNRLEVLDSVSQAITFETDINNLYHVIHEQISRVMGDVNLIIATYEPETNLIEIPYAFEQNQILSIPPFEMGDGLTSILIKSRKPLLLVEDTEKKAAELGAKVAGAPAKSWLGVPLLLGGEPIGAIIVQDLENEHRFDDEDQKLLTTLSSQVAVTLRNARLLYDASTKATLEQAAIEITNLLWSVTDVESIMQSALEQLGKKLHASTGFIQLEISVNEQVDTPAGDFLP
jgi:transcriptional regulator with GAF, ATPase, and Fis domain